MGDRASFKGIFTDPNCKRNRLKKLIKLFTVTKRSSLIEKVSKFNDTLSVNLTVSITEKNVLKYNGLAYSTQCVH